MAASEASSGADEADWRLDATDKETVRLWDGWMDVVVVAGWFAGVFRPWLTLADHPDNSNNSNNGNNSNNSNNGSNSRAAWLSQRSAASLAYSALDPGAKGEPERNSAGLNGSGKALDL